jgi:hypothetical protein
MEPEIGQVWKVLWDSGDALRPAIRGRIGVILGMDIEHDSATKLYFSCPMVKGRKTNEVSVRDWPPPHSEMIGHLAMLSPGQMLVDF